MRSWPPLAVVVPKEGSPQHDVLVMSFGDPTSLLEAAGSLSLVAKNQYYQHIIFRSVLRLRNAISRPFFLAIAPDRSICEKVRLTVSKVSPR